MTQNKKFLPKIDLNQLNKNFSKIFFKNLANIKNSSYLCNIKFNLIVLFEMLVQKKVYLNRFIFPYLIYKNNLNITEINKIKNT